MTTKQLPPEQRGFPRIHLAADVIRELDQYATDNGLSSRAAAIRHLLDLARDKQP